MGPGNGTSTDNGTIIYYYKRDMNIIKLLK